MDQLRDGGHEMMKRPSKAGRGRDLLRLDTAGPHNYYT
jgi:hypothetical protein